MKKFELNGKEFNLPTKWEEMSLEKYINLVKLEKTKDNYFISELYLIKVIECLCGVDEDNNMDDLPIDELVDIADSIQFISALPEWPNTRSVNIDGVDYVFSSDLNKITTGEYISIKTLSSNLDNDIDVIPNILSIILRPGIKVIDEVTNEEKLVQGKFDANNIEERKSIFMKHNVYDLLGPCIFFLSGNK